MNKFDAIQIELAKGASYQLILIELLCDILVKIQDSEVIAPEIKVDIEPIKKRGRPFKK